MAPVHKLQIMCMTHTFATHTVLLTQYFYRENLQLNTTSKATKVTRFFTTAIQVAGTTLKP